jgi:hypothetical protein
MDVLTRNALADTLSGYSRMAPARRNIVRQLFLEPEGRDLVGELSLKSEDFRRLWADHQVKACMYGVKRVRHPVAGLLTLPYESLVLPETPDRTLVAYTPEPGSETAERLALLGSWTSTSP